MSAFLRTASRAAAVRTTARAFSSTTPRPLARISIIGHLGAAPELKATSTGNEIMRYAVATTSGPADNRQTNWFNITAFENEGPRRDYFMSLPKGSMVYVEGDTTYHNYTDAEGNTKKALNIVQRHLEVLRRPDTGEAGHQ